MAPGCRLSVALKLTEQKLRECPKRKEENIGVGLWIPLLDFGGDERVLPGVIKQRRLHGKVSVPMAADEKLWGC